MDKRDITFLLGILGLIGIGILLTRKAVAASVPEIPSSSGAQDMVPNSQTNLPVETVIDTGTVTAEPEQTPISFSFDKWLQNMSATRGERNNNPGNIRKSSVLWQGLASEQLDPAFATFVDPEHGIRALRRLLQNYGRNGYVTISDIINHYAPGVENDTAAYVNHVSDLTGYDASAKLDLDDKATLRALVNAIIIHENGRNIYADNGQLDAGLALV